MRFNNWPSRNRCWKFLGRKTKLLLDWHFNDFSRRIRIKNPCGANEGIEGICTWKRAEQIDEKFDRKALTEAHPDIVEEFMVTSAPTNAVIVEPKAAYQDRGRNSNTKPSDP